MSRLVGRRWRQRLRGMAGYREVLVRFPVVIALLLTATFVANLLIEEVEPADSAWRVLVGLTCAAVAAISATLCLEVMARRRDIVGAGCRQLAAALAGTCGFCLVWFQDTLHTSTWLLAPSLVALIPLSPYLFGGSGHSFRGFLGRLTFAFLLAAIGWNLLGGGFSLVFVSLNLLFGLEVPFELYLHVVAITWLLFAPIFWLALIPASFALDDDCRLDRLSARAVSALGEWIATPLIFVYAAILHAYAVKCLLGSGLPSGQSGWLVSGFGVCLLVTLIVCRPFMREERVLTRSFLRYWPWLLPVPLSLVVVALAQRIGAYGVTPERYLLAALVVVLLLVALLQGFRRARDDIRLIAAVPVLLMLAASFGPQGAVATSIRSQSDRFLAIVDQSPLDAKQTQEALAALGYLQQAGGLEGVVPAGGGSSSDEPLSRETVARAWGLDPDMTDGQAGPFEYFSQNMESVSLSGFDLLLPDIVMTEGQPASVTLPTGRVLTLRLQGQDLRIESEEQGESFAFPSEIADEPQSSPRVWALTSGTLQVGVMIKAIRGTRAGGDPSVEYIKASLLLRRADWR